MIVVYFSLRAEKKIFRSVINLTKMSTKQNAYFNFLFNLMNKQSLNDAFLFVAGTFSIGNLTWKEGHPDLTLDQMCIRAEKSMNKIELLTHDCNSKAEFICEPITLAPGNLQHIHVLK